MFSSGTALLGIAVMLAAPCLESGHSAVSQNLMTELAPHCSKAAVRSKLAENTSPGMPNLGFIIVDSPAPTPDATPPQVAAPAAPAETPAAGATVNRTQDCASKVHPEKPRLG